MQKKLLIIILLGLISILLTGCLPWLFPEPNNLPVITSVPLEIATVGEEYVYNVVAADPDGDDLVYSLTTNPSTDMTIDQNSGVISWTPNTTGDFEVTVEASDGKLTDTQSFTITVAEPPNQAPVITSVPITSVILGETYTYAVEASDPNGDDLTYSLTTNPSTDMTIDQNSGVISWTPAAIGSYEVTVEVSDGKSSDIQSFSITVSEPSNQAPVITSIPVTSIILGETYTYAVEATDPDGDTLTYNLITKPTGMTISIAGIISWIPTTVGSFNVTVEVSDGELVATQSFSIVVDTDNQAPVIISIPDTTVTAGENFTYLVKATDPEGNTLTYSLTTNPSTDMAIDEDTGVINWIPTIVGSFEVTVEVSDGELSDTQNFTIEVIAPRRVVIWELFEGPACARCKAIHSDIVGLRQEYSLDELVILEEYGWDTSLYTGWGIKDVRDRYYSYFDYVGSNQSGFPAAFFNGINQFVYYGDAGDSNYKKAIEAELTKPTKIAISASYSVTGKSVNISGNIFNISSSTLNSLVIEAMVYEDSVYSEYRKYDVDHVVRDIITYEESGETISSFSPGDSYQFSLTSSYLSNVQNMNNIHVVVYVQAPNSPKMEILQALYVN